jgi:gliding motility-associated protein GldE
LDSDYYLSGLFNDVTIQALTAGPVVALSLAILLLYVSAFVSASEIAFFSLEQEDLNTIRKGDHPADNKIQHFLKNPEYLLATILIFNNLANVTVIILCTYGFNGLFDFSNIPVTGFITEVAAMTFLLLFFGEIMPKIYARKNSLRFARKSAPIINVAVGLARPLTKILVSSTSVINKALARKKNELSVDELSKALELTSDEIPEEKEMLADIIKFYSKTAKEIMTSRLDMEDLDIKSDFRFVIDSIIKTGYSRIPVFSDSEDNIRGILYIKDLLPYLDKPITFRWQSLIRPAYFVPETKKIDDLLEEFRTNKIHMAIVVDEFGGTSGIVTMEDILEEIVGEISDEYDDDEKQYSKLSDGSYIFEAKIQLSDFFRVVNVSENEFGNLTEEVETLAGLLLEIKGDLPERREIIDYKQYRFQILEADNRRILKVKYTELPMERE